MPRIARVVMDGTCNHVISRGNERKRIFHANEDHEKYLSLLAKYKEKYHGKIYGWCLMPNHIHVIIESPELSKLMHGLNMSYAMYYRYRYGGIGHFWQDRFKSFVITKDRYALNCINYVENNPVRAKLVQTPEEYVWSSYKTRILGQKNELLDIIEL